MATPARKKVTWQIIGKQMGSQACTKFSKRFKSWKQRKNKREKVEVVGKE